MNTRGSVQIFEITQLIGMIRGSAWLACQSLRCASRDPFALYKPCCVTCGAVILPDWQPYERSFFPSGRCFAGAPTLANFKPGPQGPGFFCFFARPSSDAPCCCGAPAFFCD